MKRNILLFLMPLLFFASPVGAQEWIGHELCCYEDSSCLNEMNFYGKVSGGVNFLQNTSLNKNHTKYHAGYVIGGSLGYSSYYGLCFEAEYAYRRNTISKMHFFGQGSSKHGHFQTSSYMANLLWHLPLSSWGCACSKISPFIGTGIGYDCQHLHASNSRINFHQKWNHFSWQIMAGFTYAILCNAEIVLDYKFHQGGSQFNNHSLGIGFVYKFCKL